MLRFEAIIEELSYSGDLSVVLRVIHNHYLTEREKELYELLLLNLQGKSQESLGILIGTYQEDVSVKLSSLKSKLRNIGGLLLYSKEDLEDLMFHIKKNYSSKWYDIVSYTFAANPRKAIARKLTVSKKTVYVTLHNIKNTLPEELIPIYNNCLLHLR